ncbi:hypothetical protein QLQ12_31470 [Actinoplanes sp. NEAU-A12]|uniref:Secreted protein n=1 Tax=Actinoplanes sandaracinus TaxID=3045177 RepID=A0ABT6WTX2_9ACTN|nr:hypothetical protein [Actinoplanes sandaracinus]MDI6103144.1 hypothetical protein [Actinoplanes sandaracinus]
MTASSQPLAADSDRPSRRTATAFVRLAFGLVFAALGIVMAPQPAMADAYSPCVAVESNVKVGTKTKTQSITCAVKPACGESWGQLYGVTWDMVVYSGGITVKAITMKVTHTQGEDITIGAKNLGGQSANVSLGAWNPILPAQKTWTKTYNITDKYFAKKGNGFVDLNIKVSSDKANGCNVGWRNLRYSLKPV